MIDRITEQKIKDAASVVDVIGDFYELRKRGTDYECLCPFHPDRDLGSFKVSPKRNIYKCFSCGAQGGPVDFLMNHENLSYPDALRWLGKKYSIEVDEEQRKFVQVKPSTPKPLQVQATKELCTIPAQYVTLSLDLRLRSQFQAHLCRIINDAHRIVDAAQMYALGVTKDDGVIYWLIDEQDRVRSGKIMHYLYNGHRDKEKDGDKTNWTHWKMKQDGRLPADWQLTQCMFGAHLLPRYPDKTVALVESEKSAVIASIVLPQFLWVSCGGKMNLEAGQKHLALKDRKVVMFPDTDTDGETFRFWSKKAAEWREKGFDVKVSDLLEKTATAAQKAAKIDIADLLEIDLRKAYVPSPIEFIGEDSEQEQTLVAMIEANPAVRLLIDKFDLELVA